MKHILESINCDGRKYSFLVMKKSAIREVSLEYIGFRGGSVVKNPPASAGDTGDTGLIPGLG